MFLTKIELMDASLTEERDVAQPHSTGIVTIDYLLDVHIYA